MSTLRQVMLDAQCHHCGGGVGEIKASVQRSGGPLIFFCHNNSRSCYNERRGTYLGNFLKEKP